MSDEKNTERITRADETTAGKIGRLAEKLPERQQEKILYLIKGMELAGNQPNAMPATRAAAV